MNQNIFGGATLRAPQYEARFVKNVFKQMNKNTGELEYLLELQDGNVIPQDEAELIHALKIKLFTHTDMDGIGSYVLASEYFGKENVDVEYHSYNSINESFEKFLNEKKYLDYDYCFVTDISINTELAVRVEEITKVEETSTVFALLDHHGTRAELNQFKWCLETEFKPDSTTQTCGTELFYEYLQKVFGMDSSENKDQFVKLVCNYDTWRWVKMGEAGVMCKQVNDLFLLQNREVFADWCLDIFNKGNVFPVLSETDKYLLSIRQNEIDSYVISKAREMKIIPYKGYQMGVVFADKFHSELGNTLCEKCEAIDFVAIINMPNRISFRTIKPEVNVGEIAKELGGGGHPASSGTPIKDGAFEVLISRLFDILP